MSTNTWKYYVTTVDRTNNLLHLYTNGVEVGTGMDISAVGSVSNTFNLFFGEDGYNNNWALNGTIDEARIVSGVLSAGWIGTEYNNQSSPSTFYSVGFLISQ